jgi:hypothetical protein
MHALVLLLMLAAVRPVEAEVSATAPADSLRIGSPPSAFSLKRLDPLDVLLRANFVATSPRAPSLLMGTSSLFVTRRATRFESTILGADRGAFSGLAMGAVGSWIGLWEEETAWHLMGLGAAAGAILGGISDNVDIRVRADDPDFPR